jgi:hypothetical protein
MWRKLVSPGGFLLVLLCFALPFVTVSCDHPAGTVTLDYTGGDLLLGGEPSMSGLPRSAPSPDGTIADAQLFAFLAFLAGLLGLCAGFAWLWRARALAGLLAAGLAATFLVLNQTTVLRRIRDEIEASGRFLPGAADEMVVTRYGFWLALTLLGLLVGYHLFEVVTGRSRPDMSTGEPQRGPPVDAQQRDTLDLGSFGPP